MKIIERYASAIRSSNLSVDETTMFSDTDVLGAMGLAAKEHPLACALERLFVGHNTGAAAAVAVLADMTWRKARTLGAAGPQVNRARSVDIARACLAWHRDGACRVCNGHGRALIVGTTSLRIRIDEHNAIEGVPCGPCSGTGRVPFAAQFKDDEQELAHWLVREVQHEQAQAGPEALRRIAPTLDF